MTQYNDNEGSKQPKSVKWTILHVISTDHARTDISFYLWQPQLNTVWHRGMVKSRSVNQTLHIKQPWRQGIYSGALPLHPRLQTVT
jgi:hypothetical protein